jgi:DNA-binding MarR family transcriptional regulator
VAQHDAVDEMLEAWAAVRPDLELAPMGTIGRLGRLHVLASRSIEAVFERHGLSIGEFDVLAALRRAGDPPVRAPGVLARTLMLSPAGMTNRLDRLEAAGLVRREPDPDSRRSLLVVLTEEGRRVVDAAVTEHVANEAAILSGLTATQRRTLDQALRTLLATVEPEASPGSPGVPSFDEDRDRGGAA